MLYKDFEFWIDANLPINLALHLNNKFNVLAYSVVYLDLLKESDLSIYEKAKSKKNVIILTKDQDFVDICILKIPPPYIIWISLGNIVNKDLFTIIDTKFEELVNTLLESKYPYIQLQF